MSIRIRKVEGRLVAICAARSVPCTDDVYLDDGLHYALALKFADDFNSEGLWPIPTDDEDMVFRNSQETNNVNRDWWDATYLGVNTKMEQQMTLPLDATSEVWDLSSQSEETNIEIDTASDAYDLEPEDDLDDNEFCWSTEDEQEEADYQLRAVTHLLEMIDEVRSFMDPDELATLIGGRL